MKLQNAATSYTTTLAGYFQQVVGTSLGCLLVPFRLACSIIRGATLMGRLIVYGLVQVGLALLGLSFFAFFAFAMMRTVLYPLFQ